MSCVGIVTSEPASGRSLAPVMHAVQAMPDNPQQVPPQPIPATA